MDNNEINLQMNEESLQYESERTCNKMENFIVSFPEDFGVKTDNILKETKNEDIEEKKCEIKIDFSQIQNGDVENNTSKNTIIKKKETNFLLPLPRKSRMFKQLENNKNSSSENKINLKKKAIFNVISKFSISKKFIKILKYASNLIKPTIYHNELMKIIDDKSYVLENDGKKQTGISSIKEKNKNYKLSKNFFSLNSKKCFTLFNVRKLKIFDPNELLINVWNAIHFIILLLYFFKIPIDISFDMNLFLYILENNKKQLENIQICLIIYFFIDFFVNLNTAYYKKGILILSRVRIAKRYFRSDFLLDLICLISIIYNDYLHYDNKNFSLDLVFFLKIPKFFRIFKRIQDSPHVNHNNYYYIELLKTIIRILILSHIFACIWHYIAITRIHIEDKTWLNQYDLINENWWKKYLSAYYFVCVTMNTVGYGDTIPQNEIERFFTIIFIFFACGIFAYTINVIGSIIQRLNYKNDALLNNIMLINEYMNKKNINLNLRIRIRKYLEYALGEENDQNSEEENTVINKLSSALKQELLLEANGTFIKQIPFLCSNFSHESLQKLSFLIKEIKCPPGEEIYLQGNLENMNLYFIRKGEVEIYIETPHQDKKIIINTLSKGQIFGEYSFICEQERESCARSTSFSSIFVINKEDFIKILKENPLDYQKYCEIRDNMIIFNDFKDLKIECKFCKLINHSFFNCPNLHVRFSKERILTRYLSSKNIKRENFIRNTKKSKNSLSIISIFNNNEKNIVSFRIFNDANDISTSDNYLHEEKEESSNLLKSNEEENISIPLIKMDLDKGSMQDLTKSVRLLHRENKSNFKIDLFSFEMDNFSNFQNYFQHNNYETIIENIVQHYKTNIRNLKSILSGSNFKNLEKLIEIEKNECKNLSPKNKGSKTPNHFALSGFFNFNENFNSSSNALNKNNIQKTLEKRKKFLRKSKLKRMSKFFMSLFSN